MKTVDEVATKVNSAKVYSVLMPQMVIGKSSCQKTVKSTQLSIHHLGDIST